MEQKISRIKIMPVLTTRIFTCSMLSDVRFLFSGSATEKCDQLFIAPRSRSFFLIHPVDGVFFRLKINMEAENGLDTRGDVFQLKNVTSDHARCLVVSA